MTIRFHCEHCRRTVEAPDSAGGRRGKCPYCEGSNYIPTPGDEEEIALTPLDESTERLRRQEVRDLLDAERDLLSETSHGANPSPRLSERDPSEVKSEDLHHIVVNYALDMTLGDLERAQVALAYRDDLNPDELARLARHNHSLLAVVVANPQAPREALEAAAGAPDPTIRERAASHPRADVDLLQRLARDPHPWVAAAVASNPNTPTQLLWEFAQRPEKAVKRAVLARPCSHTVLFSDRNGTPVVHVQQPPCRRAFRIPTNRQASRSRTPAPTRSQIPGVPQRR